jgi:RES domain-containing protein
VLELLVHLGSSAVLSAYVLIRCEFESEMVERVRAEQLPAAWRASPPLLEVRDMGDQWIEGRRSAVLEVPSAVLPIERNYLFNPAHADFKRVRVEEPQAFNSDSRLVGLGY